MIVAMVFGRKCRIIAVLLGISLSTYAGKSLAADFLASGTSLCTDSLPISPPRYIRFYSTGCFHDVRVTITLKETRKGIKAILKTTGTILLQPIKQHDINRQLTNSQLVYLQEFEQVLKLAANAHGDCTTTEYYTVIRNEQAESYIISDCSWKGMDLLVRRLFPPDTASL